MPLIIGKLNKSVTGTKFADEIHLNGTKAANAHGRGGDDTISDSAGNNKMYGEDGNDFIETIEGGRDSAWGGQGNDTLIAQYSGGPVKFYGDAGDDFLFGSSGDDLLDGGAGNDGLFGNGGKDTVRGGGGDDNFYFGGIHGEVYHGTSRFDGGGGRDTLSFDLGGNTEVWITGESKGYLTTQNFDTGQSEVRLAFTGTNVITTDASSEPVPLIYHGGDSDNTVIGSFQDDTFFGGQGNETFTGGGNNISGDTYVFDFRAFDPKHPRDLPMGHDVITDFDSTPPEPGSPFGAVDTIEFRGGEGVMTTAKVEHDGITTYTSIDDAGHTIHILDVIPAATDWLIV
jgi:Ca2+-binding RTX toxin-like protein